MTTRDTPYAKAVQALLEKVSELVFDGRLPAKPVTVVVAGGAAVHLYTGVRVSKDLDAEFLGRVLKPDALVSYRDTDGSTRTVHLDRAYNSTLGVMHEDYLERATPTFLSAPGFSLRLLAPVDLAISKLGRWAEHDRSDVKALVDAGLLNKESFERLAREALAYYVGNVRPVELNLEEALSLFPASSNTPPPGRRRRV
jgi:hypothetical protein